jgi:ubiquinone/menaquinone biosynthesis C-methylase UbiE
MNKPDPAEIFSLDRRAVAQAFDRASASYDAAAALQERVRNELMERLAELKLAPLHILDLGAGTGHATRALKRLYPSSLAVAADIAPGMLTRAKAQSRWLRRFERVRADAYSLPFRTGSFDLVFSSLMLQWCDDLDVVFAEIARVLRPGGTALVTAAPLFSLNGYYFVNRLATMMPIGNLVRLKQFFSTSGGLAAAFEQAGFERVEVRGVYSGPLNWIEHLAPGLLPRALKAWEPIDTRIADAPVLRELSNMFLMVGRKA